jgi:cytoskeletal protein CcmA (bactofilin family)
LAAEKGDGHVQQEGNRSGSRYIFGRVEGELRASDLLIGEGAEVEGSVVAQEVTICGRVKGTIRALRVRLQGGGVVEGDIFHKSLSIDESSLFEGSSRRVENPTDQPSSVTTNGSNKHIQAHVAPPRPSIEVAAQENGSAA